MFKIILIFAALSLGLYSCADESDEENCDFDEYYSYSEERCVGYHETSSKKESERSSSSVYSYDFGSQQKASESPAAYPSPAPASPLVQPETPCTGLCNPPKIARYSFKAKADLTPPYCSLSQLKVFDAGQGLVAVYLADCLEGSQLYLRLLAYDGAALGPELVLSGPCHAYFKGVSAFSADMSGEKLFVAYSCSSSETHTLISDPRGEFMIRGKITYSYSYQPALRVAWNSSSESFGLFLDGKLYRFSEDGVQNGGGTAVALSSSADIHQFTVLEGAWYIGSSKTTSSSSYWSYSKSEPTVSSYFSRVSSGGLPLVDSYQVEAVRPMLVSSSRVLAVLKNRLKIAAFNPRTCAMGPLQDMESGGSFSHDEILSPVALAEGYGAALTRSSGALTLLVFQTELSGGLLSRIAVADGLFFSGTELKVIKNRIYVAYVRESKGYLTFAQEEISR
jgi:hypothetical protein